jgi:hypothetical protein
MGALLSQECFLWKPFSRSLLSRTFWYREPFSQELYLQERFGGNILAGTFWQERFEIPAPQFGVGLRIFLGIGPLGRWFAQTVHKPKLQFLYVNRLLKVFESVGFFLGSKKRSDFNFPHFFVN